MATRIIAYTADLIDGNVVLSNSDDDSIVSNDVNELLDFIGEDFSDEESETKYRELKVCWDLDQVASLILRLLPLGRVRELAGPTHTSGNIFYIPSKVLSVTTDNHKSYIYHVAQYYDDEPDPKDAMVIHSKTRDLIEAFWAMGLNPYKLTSPIAVYESAILDHINIPTILDIPNVKDADVDELIEWSERCVSKDWLEAYIVGNFAPEETWDYDLQSAYPAVLSQVYNIKYSQVVKSRTFCPDAHWGLLRGTLTINPDVKVHPIIYNKENRNLTPTGTWDDVFDLNEILFVEKWRIGHFRLKEGWFVKYNAPVKPFEVPLQRVFNLRNKQGMVKKLAKRIGAACWGKLIFRAADGQLNKHYNPLMAEQTVTGTRLMVGNFIYRNKLQDSVVHVGIDGVRTTKKVHGLPEVVKMGEWKMNPPSSCLVLSPGRVYTSDKKPGGLYYDDIMRMIQAHPRESYYSANLQRRLTLGEAAELGNLSRLGTMIDTHSNIDLNLLRTGQDRIFKEFPRTGGELLAKKYYSEPMVVKE
jgi:hypothetical protein